MWRREARQEKFLRKPKIKNPGVEICQGSQCRPFLGENRDTLYHLLKQGGLWSARSCDWCGFCSHEKKSTESLASALFLDMRLVKNWSSDYKLFPVLGGIMSAKKHNPKCQAKWLRLILFVITSAERILAARSVQGCEIHISCTSFCFDS